MTDALQTIQLRDRAYTPSLLHDLRETTQDGAVVAEVWQLAAVSVLKLDSAFSEADAEVVHTLARATRETARAWLSEVARAWLGGAGPAWVAGDAPWPDPNAVPDGKGGVPAVSQALARFMQPLNPSTANDWIEAEEDRAQTQAAQLGLWLEDQPFALSGWFVATPLPEWGPDAPKARAMTARHKATPAAMMLALAVWEQRVRSLLIEQRNQIERKLNRAVTRLFAFSLSELSGPATVDTAGIVRSRKRDTGLLAQPQTPSVPAVDLEFARALIDNADLHTAPAQRTIDLLLSIAFEAHVQGGEAAGDGWRARIQYDGSIYVEFSGGQSGLAQAAGVTSNSAQGIPFRTIQALSRLHLNVETEDRGLCGALVSEVLWTRGNQKRPGRVCFTLSAWFGVGVVHRLQGRDRLLVPAVGVPPMDGIAERLQPAVASMERAAIVELADKSRELVKCGSVKVDWHRLGADRNLSREVVESVLNKWCEQDRWQRHGSGYRLGDNADVAKAHELLMIGGSMREASSRRGRVSADLARKKASSKASK